MEGLRLLHKAICRANFTNGQSTATAFSHPTTHARLATLPICCTALPSADVFCLLVVIELNGISQRLGTPHVISDDAAYHFWRSTLYAGCCRRQPRDLRCSIRIIECCTRCHSARGLFATRNLSNLVTKEQYRCAVLQRHVGAVSKFRYWRPCMV